MSLLPTSSLSARNRSLVYAPKPRLGRTKVQPSVRVGASTDTDGDVSTQTIADAKIVGVAPAPAPAPAVKQAKRKPTDAVEATIDWRMVLLCCLGPSIGGLLFGYDIGASSGALVSLTSPLSSGTDWYNLGPIDRGEIVSLSMVGACISSFIALVGQDRMGRRRELLLAACCYGFASVIMSTAPNEDALLFGRLLYGMGIGFAMHGAPAYIAETVPQKIRGLALTCKELLIVLGILLGFVASFELTNTLEGWRYIYLLSSVAAMLLGGIMYILPESPRWVMLRGESPQYARECLKRIRKTASIADRASVNRELGSIYANIARIKQNTLELGQKGLIGALYREARFRNPLLIGCSLMFFQQVTGQPSVLYYATQIFQDAGVSAEQASSYTLYVGVLKIVGTLVAVWKVDSWGRRPLLLGGVAGMTVALIGLSIGTGTVGADIFGLQDSQQAALELSSLLLYVASYQISFGPLSWLLCGEIFPLAVRGPAIALATMTNFSCNFIVSLLLPSVQSQVGLSNLYLGFSVISTIAFGVFYTAVPETKGKSLEEVEALFAPQQNDIPPPTTSTL